MSNITQTTNTPQPYRSDTWTQRSAYESELWDDYGNTWYSLADDGPEAVATGLSYTTDSIQIPCQVATRLVCGVFASYDYDSGLGAQAGNIYLIVDGGAPISFGRWRYPPISVAGEHVANEIGRFDIIDVTAGTHTVAIKVDTEGGAPTVDWSIIRGNFRRGRKPVG